jgi:hypothetical protein
MSTISDITVTVGWTALIVSSELLAYYLIQKNVDEESGLHIGVIISALLFGVIVTYSFRQILLGGTNIPLANLYWIICSQVGAILLALSFFNQAIYLKDWIATVLLLVALIVSYMG